MTVRGTHSGDFTKRGFANISFELCAQSFQLRYCCMDIIDVEAQNRGSACFGWLWRVVERNGCVASNHFPQPGLATFTFRSKPSAKNFAVACTSFTMSMTCLNSTFTGMFSCFFKDKDPKFPWILAQAFRLRFRGSAAVLPPFPDSPQALSLRNKCLPFDSPLLEPLARLLLGHPPLPFH